MCDMCSGTLEDVFDDMIFRDYERKIRSYGWYEEEAETFVRSHFLPVKYRGKELYSYFVDSKGQIFSVKRGFRNPTKLRYNYNESNCGYPKIRIDISDCPEYTNYKTATVHRLVCESFHEKPIPNGVTKQEWKQTPKSVKKCFNDYWEVNHIDHNTHNYRPSNLEWVSRQQNVDKYQESLTLKEAA